MTKKDVTNGYENYNKLIFRLIYHVKPKMEFKELKPKLKTQNLNIFAHGVELKIKNKEI